MQVGPAGCTVFIVVAKLLFIAGVGYHPTAQLIRQRAQIICFFIKVSTVDSFLLFAFFLDKQYWSIDRLLGVFFNPPQCFGRASQQHHPSILLLQQCPLHPPKVIYSLHHPPKKKTLAYFFRRMPEEDAPARNRLIPLWKMLIGYNLLQI